MSNKIVCICGVIFYLHAWEDYPECPRCGQKYDLTDDGIWLPIPKEVEYVYSDME